nr:uncharacterized protein LOC123756321 [Procambarus clarkii]
MCGVSTLKAAKNKPVSFRSLDETGISMASFRHGIILAALNMYQGELYSYAHYLQMNRLQNVSFICQDIICKYWPWALKISSREQKFSLGQGKPFLGVLHAKGHSWYCQVLYGGRWQEGCGLTSGEEAEQVFSYLSRYNNNTKNMLKAERTEELTEGALFWNHRKINVMPRALVARIRKMAKMRGAGYETVFIYYKKGLHKAAQGILPADCLTAADCKSISNTFHLYRKRKLEAAEVNQLTVEHNDSVTPLTRDSNGIGSAINQDLNDVDLRDNDKTTDLEISGIQQLDDDSSTPDMGEEEKPPKFRKICDFPGFKKKNIASQA